MTTTQLGRDKFLLVHDSETGEISISYINLTSPQTITLPVKDVDTLIEMLENLLNFLSYQK